MTDRIRTLTVVLDKDYRDDDVQAITDAIEMVKGVIKVDTHVLNIHDYTARTTARNEIAQKLWTALNE